MKPTAEHLAQSKIGTNVREAMQGRMLGVPVGELEHWTGSCCVSSARLETKISNATTHLFPLTPLLCLSETSVGPQPSIPASPLGCKLPTGPHSPAHISPASKMQMSLALCKLVNANVTPDGSQSVRTGGGVGMGWLLPEG